MTATAKPARARKRISAQDKCRAVLAVWVEQRRASEVCRQMGIRSGLFHQWQEAAMEGMLSALEPMQRKKEPGRTFSPRLQKLLEKKAAERENRRPRGRKRLTNAEPPRGTESPTST